MVLPSESYVIKRGYQLECDKPLRRGRGGGQNGSFSLTCFLNDPKAWRMTLYSLNTSMVNIYSITPK